MTKAGQKIAPRRSFMDRMIEMAEREHRLAAKNVTKAEERARDCPHGRRLKEAKRREQEALGTLNAVREQRRINGPGMTQIQRDLASSREQAETRVGARTAYADRNRR